MRLSTFCGLRRDQEHYLCRHIPYAVEKPAQIGKTYSLVPNRLARPVSCIINQAQKVQFVQFQGDFGI
jgi:hypothetical protein